MPTVPAAGMVNAWPANAADPSGATARPSLPIADAATMYGPLPDIRNDIILRSCYIVSDVLTVFP